MRRCVSLGILLRYHGAQHLGEVRQFDGQRMTVQNCAQVVHRKGNAAEEIILPFKVAPVAISAHCLKDADKDIAVETGAEIADIDCCQVGKTANVVAQQLLADSLGDVAFGAVEQRRHVILGRTSPTPLEVDIIGLVTHQHDVA